MPSFTKGHRTEGHGRLIMPKITFMGAGSTVFAKNILGDARCTPALQDSHIALYDIDAARLAGQPAAATR